jgi:glycosyltransferase involved in cell wall biosynthesis
MSQSLTVVVPCYNEENTIKQLITRVLEQEVVRELIVIDDASTDNSLKLIKEFRDKRLVYLENSVNLGKGASVKKGFEKATSEYILVQDADLEYSPEEYQRLLEPLESGYADVVFGSRFLTYGSRRALYFWHRVGNDFLTLLSNMFTNIDLTDMETCYKVMRTDIAKQIDIRENRFGLEPELTAKLAKMKLRIYEVGISYRGRTYLEGKKVTWKDGISAIRCIIKYNVFK